MGACDDQVRAALRSAENELAVWRKRGRREERLLAAWKSARRRALKHRQEAWAAHTNEQTAWTVARRLEADLTAQQRINALQMYRLGQLEDVEDRLHEAEARLAATSTLHADDEGICARCSIAGPSWGVPWPCPTIRALNGDPK